MGLRPSVASFEKSQGRVVRDNLRNVDYLSLWDDSRESWYLLRFFLMLVRVDAGTKQTNPPKP